VKRLAFAAVAGWLSWASFAGAADPTARGCVDMYERATNELHARHLRAARASYQACSDAACPYEVKKECVRRAEGLDAEIPTILFEAQGADGAPLHAVRVSVDGAPLATELGGDALEVDPGDHVFRFEAPGVPVLERAITVHQAEKLRHELVVFAPGEPGRGRGRGTTTAALVVGGAGVAGLAVGALFGVRASTLWSRAQSECGAGCSPGDAAYQTRSEAQTAATISTALFVVGSAALAGGVILYFVSRSGAGTRSVTSALSF
jgi:hypothetical protein